MQYVNKFEFELGATEIYGHHNRDFFCYKYDW